MVASMSVEEALPAEGIDPEEGGKARAAAHNLSFRFPPNNGR